MLALFALVYAYFGPYFPGLFRHQGFSISIILQDTYASLNAIFGLVTYVFSAYVVLFIIMGAFFEKIGAGTFLIDLPVALTSRFRGGPAKSSVVASTFFGMISGSATANTVTTGAFTIPLMKRIGYRPEIAGAIEPAASTGGMFMPPIMGAAAFIMAEMMGIRYVDVVKIAFVPALLYFFSVLVMVHFESLRNEIGIIPKEDRVKAWPIFLQGWYYIIPILVLLYFILSGRTPSLAGFYAIVSAAIIAVVKGLAKKDFRKTFSTLFQGLVEGGQKSLVVGVTAGPIGIIIGVALLSGLAFKFTSLVLSFTYGIKWLTLLLVFFATFVLGMGMTVISDYVILAILAVPAMGEMGIPLIAAHLTAFWFSQSSNVTPPVCIAAFAGAGIAGSKPYRTGINAMKFSAYLYVMPFLFVYTPILMLGGFSSDVLGAWISSFLSTIPFAAAIAGYLVDRLNIAQRFAMLVSCLLLLHFGMLTNAIGLLIIAAVGLHQYLSRRSLASRGKVMTASSGVVDCDRNEGS
jgi:TRAP transporter 4TM/12TM fusion protein